MSLKKEDWQDFVERLKIMLEEEEHHNLFLSARLYMDNAQTIKAFSDVFVIHLKQRIAEYEQHIKINYL